MKSQKNATSELIKAASVNRVTDKPTGKVLGYLVKSNSSEDYYEITGKKVNGVCSYACTCKAGKSHFVNCKDGKCAHVKAVIEVVEIRNQVVSTPLTTVMEQAHEAMVAFDRDCDPNAYEVLGVDTAQRLAAYAQAQTSGLAGTYKAEWYS